MGSIRVSARRNGAWAGMLNVLLLIVLGARASGGEKPAVTRFQDDIQPILIDYCYRCHADGARKGGVAFDGFASDLALMAKRDLWSAVLENVRSGIMPPPQKPRPSPQEVQLLADWIKRDVFGIDLKDPDPGRVTIRRLNRVEYRNTIRDLTGFDFKAEEEFPPDDTGYGFDTIGDVLGVSPLLLEKYMLAAESIVASAVPTVSRLVPEGTVSVKVQGPLDPKHGTRSRNYDRFFFKDEPPQADPERRQYAREILRRFATNAFRRPVDDRTLDRLVAIAEGIYRSPGRRFEQGMVRAMVAVLASPRFVFRVEATEPNASRPGQTHPLVDEYTLASRLSYFLWSTMPDQELFRLAERGELRKDLARQVKRMREDSRAESLTRNFVGQWLQVRDVEGFTINTRAVLRQDGGTRTRLELDGELRRAMRRETEMLFAHIAHEDLSVLDLIDSDYTFVNAKLAGLYGIKDVTGKEMRRVALPNDSPRGGVLTHASILLVTSNPTRTSPVKRGQFILDNILGTPAPPPPAVVPPLEESKKDFKGREPTGRELLAIHRAKPLCNSCHARMDPLGLALENFNALGIWRDKERGQPIDSSGQLISGEPFHDVRELKRVLKERHSLDFYRRLTEKLLTYALGRGLDYNDVETVDRIVERLDRDKGRFSALIMGVIESAPFQKRRSVSVVTALSTGPREPSLQTRSKP